MAFHWRADDGPLIVVFGSSLPSSTKKNFVKVGLLTKLSGPAHGLYIANNMDSDQSRIDIVCFHHP